MKRWAIAAALALASATAWAADDAQALPQIGDSTRAWLELQSSGNASLGAVRPMPGEVAEKVYQRYLKSFEKEIPDKFDREQFVSSSGS
ncbi:DUF3613 domain-containing protein [Sinimarinibacterium sp. CAU 1509]|uniref:DUF3613 domain-containing protein n=1 Tax=Sinimarinibacterium sp. CAU 1509 TaxID=2562283 RepID=UPI0010AC8F1A|nr:DUF3613 domain-containing protein [Sinimarinibacterium sp. CAU 1509]TJY56705.1 DUF3613 domain-containing protein [Sinimarinibacterium sp. CAU 1509]